MSNLDALFNDCLHCQYYAPSVADIEEAMELDRLEQSRPDLVERFFDWLLNR